MDQDAFGTGMFGSSTGTWGSKDNPIPGSDLTGEGATDNKKHIPVWAQLLVGGGMAGLIGLIASPLAKFVPAPTFTIPALQLPQIDLRGIQLGSFELPNIPNAGTAVSSAAEIPSLSSEQNPLGSATEENKTGNEDNAANAKEEKTERGGATPEAPLHFGGVLAKIGRMLNADQGINGYEALGSAQLGIQPEWMQLLKFGSVALMLGAVVSAAGFAFAG